MTFQKAQNSDLSAIVALHSQSLPDTMSSKIGTSYLRLLYSSLFQSDSEIILIAKDNRQLVGVLTATLDLSSLSSTMTVHFYRLIMHVVHALARRSITLQEVYDQFVFEKKLLKQFSTPYPTILTLCVNQSYQRKGIGRMLITEIAEWFYSNGAEYFFVDTVRLNTRAQEFYKKVGGLLQGSCMNAEVFRFELQEDALRGKKHRITKAEKAIL